MIFELNTFLEFDMRVNSCRNSLENFSSEKLIGLVEKIIEKNKCFENERIYLTNEDRKEDLITSYGATQILTKRHGREKMLNFFGYAKPRTFKEKLNYFLYNKLPSLQNT